MSDVICPICGLKYSPISHRFLNPELCPHHDDLVWCNKYDALQRKLDIAVRGLVKLTSMDDQLEEDKVVQEALKQLEGE